MSDKEIYELDVEIDSRDIDKTEKKLKSLDKLLQQTQRRATVFGKTKMAPKATLDDRVTSKVTRIRDNLMKLDRMRITPVAALIDHVSSNVGGIRASLASLTQTRWSVAVDGVAWNTVIGKSFDDWMGSEGQTTLEKISSAIGTALGNGLRGFIMQALGLVETPKSKDGGGIRLANSIENIPYPLEDESPYAEAGRRAGETFFQSFLGALDPEQIGSKLGSVGCCECGASDSIGGGDLIKKGLGVLKDTFIDKPIEMGISKSPDILNYLGNFQPLFDALNPEHIASKLSGVDLNSSGGGDPIPLQSLLDSAAQLANGMVNFGTEVANEFTKSRIMDYLGDEFSEEREIIKQKGSDGLKSLETSKSPFKKGLGEAISEVIKPLSKFGKVLNKLGTGYVDVGIDVIDIASADPGRDRVKATTSAIMSGIGSLAGGILFSPLPGGVLWGSALVSVLGGSAGEEVGDMIADWIYGKEESVPQSGNLKKLGEKPDFKSIKADQLSDRQDFLSIGPESNDPIDNLMKFMNGLSSPQKDTSNNFYISDGAVNLTIQKDEIDYAEIANLAGWQFADAVKYSMQNLKE